MNDRLQRSLDKLANAEPVFPAGSAVLVCPPLSRERWTKESRRPSFFSRRLAPKEFARQQLRHFPRWEEYEQEVALPALRWLQAISELQAKVFLDVDFMGFQEIFLQPEYRVLFLIAHNMEQVSNRQLEFADGGITYKKFQRFLKQNTAKAGKSLVLLVCQSGELRDEIAAMDNLEMLGGAYQAISLVDGLGFLYAWVAQMDGHRTLVDAYNLAIKNYLE